MTICEELLQKFFDAMQKPDALFVDLKKHLTITQQQECLYIDRISVEGQLMGILYRLKNSEGHTIKEKVNTNQVMKDLVIKFKNVEFADKGKKDIKIECRMIKEIGVRKTSVEGTWGVNASSFKQI